MRKTVTLDRGLAYGEACFETFRVVDGKVFSLSRHQQRLIRAAAQFGWLVDATSLFDEAISSAQTVGRDVLVRLTLTGGQAPWGLLPENTVPSSWLQTMPTPIRPALHLRSVDCGEVHLHSRDVKRNGDYANMLRIHQQNHDTLLTSEHMLLCANGKVLSTISANILFFYKNRWITPDGDGILAGIIRGVLLEKQLIEVAPCKLPFITADCQAMACINSGVFIQAVASVDGRKLDVHPKIFQPFLDFFHTQLGTPVCL